MKQFGLDTKIDGVDMHTYMAQLIEKNEKQEIEIERSKQIICALKQMNNTSRLLIETAKFELKEKEFNMRQNEA